MAGLTPKRSVDHNVTDYTWLAEFDGLDSAEPATLNAATFDVDGGHKLENWIRSGTPVAKLADGSFSLYDPDATSGAEQHYGFLKSDVQLRDPKNGTLNEPLTGAVLNWGQVYPARIPGGFNATGANVSSRFNYR